MSAFVAGTCLFGVPVHAKRPSPSPHLAGETTFFSPEGGAGRVVVDRPARLSARAFGNPDVDLHAGPDFTALVIVKEPLSAQSPQWVASRWQWCSADGCSPRDRTVVETINWPQGDVHRNEVVLSRGAYRVFVFSDRGGASATLRAEGLDGHASLSLSQSVAARVSATEHLGAAQAAGEVRVANDQETLGSAGLHMFAAAVDSADANYGAFTLTECLAAASPRAPEVDPLPGSCSAHDGTDFGGPPLRDEVWTHRSLDPGTYLSSASYLRAGTTAPSRGLRLAWAWLAFE